MVRLKDMDALEDLSGKLADGFRGVALRELQQRLVSVQPVQQQDNAAGIVAAFYLAAEKLKERETGFDRKAKPGMTGLDLKANLRSPEHVADMRSFHNARQDLLSLPGGYAEKIAAIVSDTMTEKIVAAPKAQNAAQTPANTGPRNNRQLH